jgi:prepilin-type N-terminal cleavage/methylation domain-containing protein
MRPKPRFGFSLIETVVAIAALAIVAVGMYSGFVAVSKGMALARMRNGALALANEELELVRGMAYEDVGTVGGLPAGKLPATSTVDRGVLYQVKTTVRSIDLPFDGTIGGSPNDTAPADQKLVEVAVTCETCHEIARVSTRVSPESLESSSQNGALFVQVVDAAGLPVEGADVRIVDTKPTLDITINDRTGVDGFLRVVDVPTGTAAYAIEVSKAGYSSARTYPPGGATNPVPTLPDVNVAKGGVTQVTFAIDEYSTLAGSAVDTSCAAVPGFDFSLFGQKLIGLDTYKYDAAQVTGSGGSFGPVSVEWDQYSIEPTDATWTLVGTNPPQPFEVAPRADAEVQMIVAHKSPRGLLVKVVDDGTGLPVAGATVGLSRTGWSAAQTTGLGSVTQTTWTGGAGSQDAGATPSGFWSSDGHINYSGTAGVFTLTKTGSNYATSGWLESSTFDTGTSTQLVTLGWLPGDQPSQAGASSLRFQLAGLDTVTATSTWSYVGPSGTAATYFTSPGEGIPSALNGKRYYRYKAFLSTAKTKYAPTVSDVLLTYTLGCAPAGQTFFSGLAASNAYTLTVSAPGYQTKTLSSQSVQADWKETTVRLTP